MKILPTLEGGLCILPESDADWAELELISSDATQPSHLAQSLADLMDEDSAWDEYVLPDLEETFRSQGAFVSTTIRQARESKEAGVFITPAHADKWYGAINQARLCLQARYELEDMEETIDTQQLDPELRNAFFRNRFYLLLQSTLLDFVMDRPD